MPRMQQNMKDLMLLGLCKQKYVVVIVSCNGIIARDRGFQATDEKKSFFLQINAGSLVTTSLWKGGCNIGSTIGLCKLFCGS